MHDMDPLINPEVLAYAEAHSTAPPPHLAAVDESTRRDFPMWGMMVGRQEGRFLELLVFAAQATSVLEIGTFTGYSSLAMALGLPDVRIIACDASAEWTATARRFWERAGVAGRIELRLGPAVETLRKLEAEKHAAGFDLAFIDANKEDYDAYYESALRLVRRGGVITIDNTLRGGKVADLANDHPSVAPVRALNAKIAADERVDRVILPIGDGMTLVRKR